MIWINLEHCACVLTKDDIKPLVDALCTIIENGHVESTDYKVMEKLRHLRTLLCGQSLAG